MTENEWLTNTCALDLLESVRGIADEHQLRLFCWACCLRVEHWLQNYPTTRKAVTVIHQVAVGKVPVEALDMAADTLQPVSTTRWGHKKVRLGRDAQAIRTVAAALNHDAWEAARAVVQESIALLSEEQCSLLREFIAYPGV